MGELGALAAAVFWAGSAVSLRSQTGKLPVLAINAFTGGYAALVFWVALVALGRVGDLITIPPEALFGLLGSVLIGMAVGDTLYLRAMHAIGVARALPIATTFPIPTALLSLLLLGEPVTWWTFAGAGLVVVGVYLVGFRAASRAPDPGGLSGRGVLYAAGAACCWAVSPVLLKPSLDMVDPILANAIRLPTACLVLIALSLRGPPPGHPFAYGARTAAILAMAGLFNGLSSIFWLIGLSEAGAARAAALSATAPIFAAPLAAIFLKERLSAPVVVGTTLSIAGIALVIR